jgi:hypothetical protein
MLDGLVDWHWQTLLHKCAGLTAEQLKRRSVEPSDRSPGGRWTRRSPKSTAALTRYAGSIST